MKKWLLIIVGALVALVALIAIVGTFLPKDHVASRQVSLKKPPQAVFDVIADVEGAQKWRPGLEGVEMLGQENGRLRFREKGAHDVVLYEVMESTAPSRRVVRIADESLPYGGTWTFELAADGEGTKLTITEAGEVKNVIFRALARFVFGHTKTLEDYLVALGKHLGETVHAESP